MTSTPTKNAPAATIRRGRVSVAIWENKTDKGSFFSATFERTYKAADGSLQSTSSFGRDDVLVLAELARESHAVICDLVAASYADINEQAVDSGGEEVQV